MLRAALLWLSLALAALGAPTVAPIGEARAQVVAPTARIAPGFRPGLRTFGPSLPATVLIAAEGNSITAGFGNGNVSHIDNMTLTPGPTYTLKKIANSGDTSGTMGAEFASGTCLFSSGQGLGPCVTLFPRVVKIAYLAAGANDGPGDQANSLGSYRNQRAIVRAARAAGYDRIGVATLISRGASGGTLGGAIYDANTVYFNTLVRALWNSDLKADYLFDYGAIAGYVTRAAQLAAGYTPDDTHPNAAGYAPMTTLAATGFNALVASAGTRVAPPATWSYIDYTDLYLVLSNGNRTAAWGPGFGDATVQGFPEIKGLAYWETVTDNINATLVGLCNEAFSSVAPSNNLGSSANGIALLTGYGGDVYYNGSLVLAAWETWANGDVQQWAVNRTTSRLWIKKPGGLWNGSGTANPATGVGGIDISGLGAGNLRAAAYIGAPPGQVTTRFTPAQQAGSPPSGYGSIGFLLDLPRVPANDDDLIEAMAA